MTVPIYEYACAACHAHTEQLQKIDAPPLTDCPSCGRSELKRLVSPAGFRLKGGGWYETDFKQSGKRHLAGEAGGGAKPDAASDAAADKKQKSEDKPAPAAGSAQSAVDKNATPASSGSATAPR